MSSFNYTESSFKYPRLIAILIGSIDNLESEQWHLNLHINILRQLSPGMMDLTPGVWRSSLYHIHLSSDVIVPMIGKLLDNNLRILPREDRGLETY